MATSEQDIIGTKFGNLTIIRRATEEERANRKGSYWYAECDCEGKTGGPGFKIVNLSSMRKGYGTHCGCKDKKMDFEPLPADFKPGSTFKDLTGQTFGRLTVQKVVGKKGKEYVWHCICNCSNKTEINVIGVSLRAGRTKSCGCLKYEADHASKGNANDLTGQKFGHLTALTQEGTSDYGQAIWRCECDCKNHTQLLVYGSNLVRGHTTSCGCDRRSHGEKTIEGLLEQANIPFVQEKNLFKFSNGVYARADFFVDDKYVIEFDGQQHFKTANRGWDTKESFNRTRERDAIKNQWCKDNNIPLIRIPYTRLDDLCLEDLLLETSKFIIS